MWNAIAIICKLFYSRVSIRAVCLNYSKRGEYFEEEGSGRLQDLNKFLPKENFHNCIFLAYLSNWYLHHALHTAGQKINDNLHENRDCRSSWCLFHANNRHLWSKTEQLNQSRRSNRTLTLSLKKVRYGSTHPFSYVTQLLLKVT